MERIEVHEITMAKKETEEETDGIEEGEAEKAETSLGILEDESQSAMYFKIKELKPIASLIDYRWDEMGFADLFADFIKDHIRFCREAGEWYYYDGTAWRPDGKSSIFVNDTLKTFTRLMNIYATDMTLDAKLAIAQTGKTDPREASDTATSYAKYVAQFTDRRVRDRVLKDAQSEAVISSSDFDKNPYLINCRNVTFDLNTMKSHPHDPEDYLTMVTNCDYLLPNTDASCERWYQFIDQITEGNKEKAEAIQIYLGYALLGFNPEECMFFALGKTTRNGKGTLLNTITSILGDYADAINPKFICRAKYDNSDPGAPNPMLLGLKGKRLIVMSESDEYGILDSEKVKQYTGNDFIHVRGLYADPVTFLPNFKMWLMCNSLPAITDKSVFSSDRVITIEFTKHFSEEERDITLKSQFAEDEAKSVIFQWIIDGYVKYKKKGLVRPKCIMEANESYELRNDKVAVFVSERCEKADVDSARSLIYNNYSTWAKSEQITPKSSQRFYDDLESLGFKQVVVKGIRCFHGIKISLTPKVSEGQATIQLSGDDDDG